MKRGSHCRHFFQSTQRKTCDQIQIIHWMTQVAMYSLVAVIMFIRQCGPIQSNNVRSNDREYLDMLHEVDKFDMDMGVLHAARQLPATLGLSLTLTTKVTSRPLNECKLANLFRRWLLVPRHPLLLIRPLSLSVFSFFRSSFQCPFFASNLLSIPFFPPLPPFPPPLSLFFVLGRSASTLINTSCYYIMIINPKIH